MGYWRINNKGNISKGRGGQVVQIDDWWVMEGRM